MPPIPQFSDFAVILPVLILTVWACALLLVDLFIPAARKGITAALAVFGLALTLGFTLLQTGGQGSGFSGMVVQDGFSVFLNVLLLLSGMLGVALSYGYNRRMGIERGEYHSMLLFSIIGMLLMVQAADLIVVFLALELLSLPLYVLSAFDRSRNESEEAGIKYFLLGAFSTGFVVYGIALIFGATGHTSIYRIVESAAGGANTLLLSIGAALVLVGFGFKVAAVPFHMWTPDVYQGAPTSVTAFMSSGAKIAGFAALLRVFSIAFPTLSADFTPILWGLAAVTMITGNLIAISQTNIKRLLAYSSIAHAGYILMAFVPYGNLKVMPQSVAAGLFYLATYMLTNFGAWAVVIALEKAEGRGLEISDYAGLGRKYPALAAAMTVFMLSFIGFPPTLGLIGKFYLFRAALDGGFVGLAIIGVLTSLISAYYYLRVVVTMYMHEGEPQRGSEFWLDFTWVVTAVATVALSLFPQVLFVLVNNAALLLM